MLRGHDTIGVPVSLPDGQVIERTSNWIIDIQTNQLLGFVVAGGGWSGGAEILLWKDIHKITPTSLDAASQAPIIEIGSVLKAKQALERSTHLIGLEVVLRSGENLGEISDFFFDASSGRVIGLDASYPAGMLTSTGHVFIPINSPLYIVNDIVILQRNAVAKLDAGNAPNRYMDPYKSLEAQIDVALGHRLMHDVRDEQGYILAALGQIVTREIIKTARSKNQEIELLKAVGLDAREKN